MKKVILISIILLMSSCSSSEKNFPSEIYIEPHEVAPAVYQYFTPESEPTPDTPKPSVKIIE